MTLSPTEKGVLERERLREARARNYRIKRAADWTCQHDGCNTDYGVLVAKGSTFCKRHLGKRKPNPGQWIDNRRDDDE